MRNNILENLELKLQNTRLENSEKLDTIETEYKKEYSDFFDSFIGNDYSWFKRIVSVSFQLDKLDNPDKSNDKIFKEAINKWVKVLLLKDKDKILLESKLSTLLWQKDKISEIYIQNSDLRKDFNFPILESMEQFWVLTNEELLNVSLKYKETPNFLESIKVLGQDKVELIKSHFYELNDTKNESRVWNFELDFWEEIKLSPNIQAYPKVIKFIWKNYFRLRLKWRVESKKDALRRLFKIVFLKLYRLKYSWIDITHIINEIDSLDDLNSMISLLLKFFEQLKQNPSLSQDYIVSDEIDEVAEVFTEAEENKEKVLFLEKNTIKASSILEAWDQDMSLKNLDDLLQKNVDLVGNIFISRSNEEIDDWIKAESQNIDIDEDEEDEEWDSEEVDLVLYFEKLKQEFWELDKRKTKLFLEWNYDELDLLNDDLLNLTIKMQKVSKLLWIEY